MKYIEKEKLWTKIVREVCKSNGWKFKSYFAYKTVGEHFFCSFFFVRRKENVIYGSLGYKPMNIDNMFWDIINEPLCKKRPLSHRGDAIFCVREFSYFDYEIEIKDELNPKSEIEELLKRIDKQVVKKSNVTWNMTDFRNELLENEKFNTTGIITSFIEQGHFEKALSKIEEYRLKKIPAGLGFGDKDFYDVAKEYCEKNTLNKEYTLNKLQWFIDRNLIN